ncbi:kinesin light chain 1 [Colletotrichum tofieldiae]|nr:kinesin light chain 1 [Colletotrichum tofieldiae]
MEGHVTALKALHRWNEAIVILRDLCWHEASNVARVVEQTLKTRLNLAHTLRYAGYHREAVYEYHKCLEIQRAASQNFKDEAHIRIILKYLAYLYELMRDRNNALIAYSQLQRGYQGRLSQHHNFFKLTGGKKSTTQWMPFGTKKRFKPTLRLMKLIQKSTIMRRKRQWTPRHIGRK